MFFKRFLLSVLLSLSSTSSVHSFMGTLNNSGTFNTDACACATLNNSGTLRAHSVIASKTINNTGKLLSPKSIELRCGILTGDGLIKSHNVIIYAEDFRYNGTIECNGKCTIIVQKSFDQAQFRQVGNGEFIIIVEPELTVFSDKRAIKFAPADSLENNEESESADAIKEILSSLKPLIIPVVVCGGLWLYSYLKTDKR